MLDYTSIFYLLGAICFILSLRGLSSPESARRGLFLGALGMCITVVATFFIAPLSSWLVFYLFIVVAGSGLCLGGLIGHNIPLTAIPQLVAIFHSLVGLSAVFVAWGIFLSPEHFMTESLDSPSFLRLIEVSIGCAFGMLTFCASLIAFGKLQGLFYSSPIILPARHFITAILVTGIIVVTVMMAIMPSVHLFGLLTVLSCFLGIAIIIPIGGADMPVAISMLNSFSGWTAAGVGFSLSNMTLIITGALVGASGAILSYIMCRAMNRSILSVIAGGFGTSSNGQTSQEASHGHVTQGGAADAAFLMANSRRVIIVPGYGMAVAKAQHALKEMADLLKKRDITVSYAIHPVAGRMPGHMNVLLAEAHILYEDVFEMETINSQFPTTDVVYIIGANDVTNPAAQNDSSSPIYGMPVLEVWKASSILFVKRSLSAGYAGVSNPLFYEPKTMMLLEDARIMTEKINQHLHIIP